MKKSVKETGDAPFGAFAGFQDIIKSGLEVILPLL